ncbi:MAG: type II toxin-antitoxin system RelE family toxin, partial [Candidatus Binatus sp.]
VKVLPKAVKALAQIPRETQLRIARRIDSLASDPRPFNSERVKPTNYLRIRSGDYRIIYGINDSELLVTVAVVGHRREVYRAF